MNQRDREVGSVGAELTRLLSGQNPKRWWLLGGIFASVIAARVLLPRLGWNLRGLRLQLVLAAVWFVVLILIAVHESRKRAGGG